MTRAEATRIRLERASFFDPARHSAAHEWAKGMAISFAFFTVLSLSLASGFRRVALVYAVIAGIFAIAFIIAVLIRNRQERHRDTRKSVRQVFAEREFDELVDALAKADSGRREPATYDQPTFEVGT